MNHIRNPGVVERGMADIEASSPESAATRNSSRRQRLMSRLDKARDEHRWVDHLARSVENYRRNRVEYFSMNVVSRGLFLTVSVMLVFLYIFDLTTSLMPGINEITIPTMALPDEKDLGAAVHLTFEHSRGALMGIVGLFTLLISAAFTAKALRKGTAQLLWPEQVDQVHTLQFRNLAIGLALALAVLASWVLGFTTAIRSSAIRTLVGLDVATPAIQVGKSGMILLTWVLVTLAIFIPLRAVTVEKQSRTILLGSAVFAVFMVGANFLLLYSYIATLIDPDSSSGVVLVLTLLVWVNAVVRGLFFTQCWIAESTLSTPGAGGKA